VRAALAGLDRTIDVSAAFWKSERAQTLPKRAFS
jgi:hypothetical protein